MQRFPLRTTFIKWSPVLVETHAWHLERSVIKQITIVLICYALWARNSFNMDDGCWQSKSSSVVEEVVKGRSPAFLSRLRNAYPAQTADGTSGHMNGLRDHARTPAWYYYRRVHHDGVNKPLMNKLQDPCCVVKPKTKATSLAMINAREAAYWAKTYTPSKEDYRDVQQGMIYKQQPAEPNNRLNTNFLEQLSIK